jgi:hypothetical protein
MLYISGVSSSPLAIAAYPGMTSDELKAQIENVSFVPASMFTLSANGVALTGTLSLEDEASIECLVGGDAGMRAKWRKKRMRRLRRKRRKMRQRAR